MSRLSYLSSARIPICTFRVAASIVALPSDKSLLDAPDNGVSLKYWDFANAPSTRDSFGNER